MSNHNDYVVSGNPIIHDIEAIASKLADVSQLLLGIVDMLAAVVNGVLCCVA